MPPEHAVAAGGSDLATARELFNFITTFGLSLVVTVGVIAMCWFYGKSWFQENIKTQQTMRRDLRIVRYQHALGARVYTKLIDIFAKKCNVDIDREIFDDLKSIRNIGEINPASPSAMDDIALDFGGDAVGKK